MDWKVSHLTPSHFLMTSDDEIEDAFWSNEEKHINFRIVWRRSWVRGSVLLEFWTNFACELDKYTCRSQRSGQLRRELQVNQASGAIPAYHFQPPAPFGAYAGRGRGQTTQQQPHRSIIHR